MLLTSKQHCFTLQQEAASAEYLYCVVEGDHVEREYGHPRSLPPLRIPVVHKEPSQASAAGSSSPPPMRRDVYSMGLHQPPSEAPCGDAVYHTLHCRDYWRPQVDHRNVQFSDVFLRGVLKPAPGHAARDYVRLDPGKYTGPVLRFNFTNPRVETGHRYHHCEVTLCCTKLGRHTVPPVCDMHDKTWPWVFIAGFIQIMYACKGWSLWATCLGWGRGTPTMGCRSPTRRIHGGAANWVLRR